jgi:pyruvate formate lyase activating enzyme
MYRDEKVTVSRASWRKCTLYAAEDGLVRCNACMHGCLLRPGQYGVCGVRMNRDGALYGLLDYVSHARTDPIERKPLFHYRPGSLVYSIGGVGCNFKCEFCQNYMVSIEFSSVELTRVSPMQVIRQARREGVDGIAFTFNEPAVTPESVHDVARLAHKKGFFTVMATNGYLSKEAVAYLAPHVDACIVGVKTFDADFYARTCSASLERLKTALSYIMDAGWHVELSYLVRKDDRGYEDFLSFLSRFERSHILHLGKFFPAYKSTDDETPEEMLASYYTMARDAGINYVYISDLYGSQYENTVCPSCGATLVERMGHVGDDTVISPFCASYDIVSYRVTADGHCPECGQAIRMVGGPTRQD